MNALHEALGLCGTHPLAVAALNKMLMDAFPRLTRPLVPGNCPAMEQVAVLLAAGAPCDALTEGQRADLNMMLADARDWYANATRSSQEQATLRDLLDCSL